MQVTECLKLLWNFSERPQDYENDLLMDTFTLMVYSFGLLLQYFITVWQISELDEFFQRSLTDKLFVLYCPIPGFIKTRDFLVNNKHIGTLIKTLHYFKKRSVSAIFPLTDFPTRTPQCSASA